MHSHDIWRGLQIRIGLFVEILHVRRVCVDIVKIFWHLAL